MPEDTHWTTIIQMAVVTAKPVAEMPSPDQGEMVASPSPEPSAISTSEVAAAATDPARIAAQDTADTADSTGWAATAAPYPARMSLVSMVQPVSARQGQAE